MRVSLVCYGFVLALFAPSAPSFATAATEGILVGTGGFESPDFLGGTLVGQNGWLQTPAGSSTATIETVDDGQAVRIDHVDADRRWAVLPGLDVPSGRFVTIAWDMAVQVTQEEMVLGPFFGVEAYSADGGFSVLGSLGVDATTGQVLIQEAGTGYFTTPGPVVESGVWTSYAIELDFEQDVYRSFVNGSLLATTGFVDDSPTNELNSFSDADLSTLAVQASDGTGHPGVDSAFVDNFVVVDGLLGDFNADGTVDLGDYTVWRDTLGTVGLAPAADASGDGLVGLADYEHWRGNFGRSNMLSTPLTAPAQVPEPATLALGGLIAAVVAGRFRRVG